MADEWEAECAEADFPPGAPPDLPNDWSGASVSATPRVAIKAAAYIHLRPQVSGHYISAQTIRLTHPNNPDPHRMEFSKSAGAGAISVTGQ
jgi:hypothetical protein